MNDLGKIGTEVPVDKYWTVVNRNRVCSLYFHISGFKLRMASTHSKHTQLIDKLLVYRGVSLINIDDEVGDRAYVLMKALPSTPGNKVQTLMELIANIDSVDIHYWAWKFGNENQNVVAAALRKLFRIR